MKQAVVFSGFVKDMWGDPLRGVAVIAVDSSDGLRKFETVTDARGSYAFEGLGEEPIEVEYRHAGYLRFRASDQQVNTSGNDVSLRRTTALLGTVVDANGAPIRGFTVSVPKPGKGRSKGGSRRRGSRTGHWKFTFDRVREDGRFRLDVPAGKFTVSIVCDGFVTMSLKDVEIPADGQRDLGRLSMIPE